MKNRDKHNKRSNSQRLRKLASLLNLSLSNCIAIGNKMIGLDRRNKTLHISEEDDLNSSSHIELAKIKSVSLKKSYGTIRAGELRNKTIGQFLKYIRLQFEHINSNRPTVLSLYEEGNDHRTDLDKLDSRSKNLYVALSKIIGTENRTRFK